MLPLLHFSPDVILLFIRLVRNIVKTFLQEGGTTMRQLHPGAVYVHFKGNRYRALFTAIHSETHEPLAVYESLYDSGHCYVRPLNMFLSEVDHQKYPEVKQKYRFQLESGEEDDDEDEGLSTLN
jgi:hypothetical protein